MLKQQIHKDATDSLKAGDNLTTTTLRLLLASVASKEKEKRYKLSLEKDPEFTDEEVQAVVSSEIKKRRDAIALYEQGKRLELAEKERKEIEVLQKYLPEQLSSEDLKKLVEESIAKTGAKEIKETGKIMADLMPKVKGKAEGSEISKVIKEILSK
ncbi:MAG: hypothetical protein A2599_01105 [Candidatus Staskawiczbacteria bacterium RIFOXYD1_FULL_39_28]|uniref:Glutamyl-tRNA amidotransferase n=1 Tax=Candidatus Staskawiczbacteria bacterium RIFOXYC1_FULL_38_18 TaxID=1802229 RepID=A0A1G2JAB6_9BACT|nr:MAG: hypothetical protein A2401_00825 [Candidatus Staskawiczbacteria bacterium RIFOXYC1_FULL_38_18]OGZ91432.1 MAG: hypothetical protein A2599_01105 [Candidatus Staskawiczbacteria bacterium RIFOXYD1_FULL_39_28]